MRLVPIAKKTCDWYQAEEKQATATKKKKKRKKRGKTCDCYQAREKTCDCYQAQENNTSLTRCQAREKRVIDKFGDWVKAWRFQLMRTLNCARFFLPESCSKLLTFANLANTTYKYSYISIVTVSLCRLFVVRFAAAFSRWVCTMQSSSAI